MQLKYPFDIQKIGEKNVATPIWKDKPVFEGIVTLNDTGAFIFETLKDNVSENELIQRVLKEFSCSEEDAIQSVRNILEGLKAEELINE